MPTQIEAGTSAAAAHDAAAQFLQDLPAPWDSGPVRAHHLAQLLLDRVDETGWPIGPALRARLTSRPSGVRDHQAVLAARIRGLPPYEAPPPRPTCTECSSTSSRVTGTTLCVPCALSRRNAA